MTREGVTLNLEKEVYQKFKKFCDENGLKISVQIELMIKRFLNNKNKEK